jgi:phage portal protein BeeE
MENSTKKKIESIYKTIVFWGRPLFGETSSTYSARYYATRMEDWLKERIVLEE